MNKASWRKTPFSFSLKPLTIDKIVVYFYIYGYADILLCPNYFLDCFGSLIWQEKIMVMNGWEKPWQYGIIQFLKIIEISGRVQVKTGGVWQDSRNFDISRKNGCKKMLAPKKYAELCHYGCLLKRLMINE